MSESSQPSEKLSVILEDLAARFILTCPEEEFASFERLFFMIEAAHWFYVDHYLENDASLPSLGMKEFARRLFKACPMLTKFQHSVEEHLKGFSQYKVGVPVYGAIILDATLSKCLLVKSWGRNGTWTFPKGKVNQDESEAACAIREVWEEVGYDVSGLLRERDALSVTVNDHSMKLYIIPGVPESTRFVTQTVKEISKIEWFPVKDLPLQKSPGNNFFLVMPFVRQLQDWIKCRRAGKHWQPPTTSTSRGKRDAPPPSPGGGGEGAKEPRSVSVPHQRPKEVQLGAGAEGRAGPGEAAGGVAPAEPGKGAAGGAGRGEKGKPKQRRGSTGARGDTVPVVADNVTVQILQRENLSATAEAGPAGLGAETCRGNLAFGGGFKFDSAAVMEPLHCMD